MSEAAAIRRGASMSENGLYRWSLDRSWGEGPILVFIGLNPSTADDIRDDPTTARCIAFARREGCGAIKLLNLYAFRTKDPAYLRQLAAMPFNTEHVVGPENDLGLRVSSSELLRSDGTVRAVYGVVAAWGAHPFARDRIARAIELVGYNGHELKCLGTTKDGSPRHPLYVKGDQPLLPWSDKGWV